MAIKDILASNLGELSETAFGVLLQEVKRRQGRPCAKALEHQRMIEKLERKGHKHRVFALRARLAHHRLWRRVWESRCEALNLCSEEKGC